MKQQTAARIKRLEQCNRAKVTRWTFCDLHQSADNPALWATARDGSDFATLAEHESRMPEHTIVVCHYRSAEYA